MTCTHGKCCTKQRVQDYHDVEVFAKIVGRSCFTYGEWGRHWRINAQKQSSGRGAFTSWVMRTTSCFDISRMAYVT